MRGSSLVGLLHAFHLHRHLGADRGAGGEEEIGDDDAIAHIGQGEVAAELIGEVEVLDVMLALDALQAGVHQARVQLGGMEDGQRVGWLQKEVARRNATDKDHREEGDTKDQGTVPLHLRSSAG